MKRPPLHRLKNGAWVALDEVCKIEPIPADDRYDQKTHVQVTACNFIAAVNFKTLKSAQAYADELAEIRNSFDLES